jgi:hypothetical protein
LANKIIVALSTRFDRPMATIKKYFDSSNVDQWAKVQRNDGGDRMLASSMLTSMEDRRDATFVRVMFVVSIHSWFLTILLSSMSFWSMPMPAASD